MVWTLVPEAMRALCSLGEGGEEARAENGDALKKKEEREREVI